jgi:hypothetical protein
MRNKLLFAFALCFFLSGCILLGIGGGQGSTPVPITLESHSDFEKTLRAIPTWTLTPTRSPTASITQTLSPTETFTDFVPSEPESQTPIVTTTPTGSGTLANTASQTKVGNPTRLKTRIPTRRL